MAAGNLAEVIQQLTAIVEDSRRSGNRIGYFAALYRRITRMVAADIEGGRFQDNPRMERLDVIFANRYLDAYEAWRNNRPVSRSWAIAFQATSRWEPLVMTHLLAGMNAHINLDLGIAAAETSPGAAIHALERDFTDINRILFSQMDSVQEVLSRVSPWMWILDKVGERTDERIGQFSIAKARKLAWANALLLAPLHAPAREPLIRNLDGVVSRIGERVLAPPPVLRAASLLIRLRERGTPASIIQWFE